MLQQAINSAELILHQYQQIQRTTPYEISDCRKPSVARDIATVLGAVQKRNGYLEGNGYRVTWCIGHLVQLAAPEAYAEELRRWKFDTLPIIPEQFQYQVVPATQKTICHCAAADS